MRLINIPGTRCWVNPEYVTNVRAHKPTPGLPNYVTEIEFEGNAGYRTRSALSTATEEELVTLLQGPPPASPDEGLEIQRTLVVSTAHLPKPYFDWLQWQKRWNPAFHDVPLPTEIDPAARSNQYLIIDSIGDYGWRICLAPGSANLFMINHELDDPLAMLIRFAEAHDCDWLGIDRDGPIIPGLPTFEE